MNLDNMVWFRWFWQDDTNWYPDVETQWNYDALEILPGEIVEDVINRWSHNHFSFHPANKKIQWEIIDKPSDRYLDERIKSLSWLQEQFEYYKRLRNS